MEPESNPIILEMNRIGAMSFRVRQRDGQPMLVALLRLPDHSFADFVIPGNLDQRIESINAALDWLMHQAKIKTAVDAASPKINDRANYN